MKPKTTSTVEIKLITSEKVQDALPKALIDYLWSLIYSESASKNKLQIFELSASRLCGREVQDIVHLEQNSELRRSHRVFGFMPVNGEIHVIRLGKGYYMIFAKEKICYKCNYCMNLQYSSCPLKTC
jgi:hypothetical protein